MSSHNTNQAVLHFHRWSRNRYAAFCSMGRCVNIGTLSCKIADCSLKKQGIHLSCPRNFVDTNVYPSDTDFPPLIDDRKEKQLFIPIVNRRGIDTCDTIHFVHPYKKADKRAMLVLSAFLHNLFIKQ